MKERAAHTRNLCISSALGLLLLLGCLLVSLVVSLPISSVSAFASGADATHQYIFEQARTILRNDKYKSYADFLDSVEPISGLTYLKIMIKGNDDNDVPWKPWEATEHYMDPMDHKGWGIFKSAGKLCQERFDEAVSYWKNGDLYNAMYNLGWALHLVQDACVPHHVWPTTTHRHVEYEQWVNDNKHLFAVDSNGTYTFLSFPDRQYYPTYNSELFPQSGWHYDGANPTAYDWVDYNAHESIKYILSAGASFFALSDPADPYVETIHPLPNNLETTWVITTYQTSRMRLHFEKIDLESPFDYLSIYDKNNNLLENFTGLYIDHWTPWYDVGDTLKMKITTDSSHESWGYKLIEVAYDDTGQDEHGATNVLLHRAQRTTAGFIKFFFDPLWSMLQSFNTSLGYNVDAFSNSTIERLEYSESDGTIKMQVSNTTADQTRGFCRLTIPHSLLSPPYNAIINDNPVAHTTIHEDDKQSIVHFTYEHSTLEIIIVPEFSPLIIPPLLMISTLLAVIFQRKKCARIF